VGSAGPEAEPSPRPVSLGIDLGTSYARAGVWQGGDVLLIRHGARHAVAMPCWVAFTSGGVLVGEAAREQADSNMENTIFAPQRLVGFRMDSHWVKWYMRLWPSHLVRGEDDRPLLRVSTNGEEQHFKMEELVAMILSAIRRGAERQLGCTVRDVCMTVPGRYGKIQREALLEACEAARLNVVHLLKAPTAGAIAYSLAFERRTKGHVLVCDIGSNYFDYVLLYIDGHSLTERAFGTDYVNFDKSLIHFCLEDLKDKWGVSVGHDRRVMRRLERACEAAKKHLSQYNRARVEIKNLAQGLDYSCVVQRYYFEDVCREDLASVLDPITWCLEDCGLERSDVRELVLVGGSAHIPVLKRAIGEFFYGLKPVELQKPEHAAVLGATAYAAALVGRANGEVPAQLEKLRLTEAGDELVPRSARPLPRDGRTPPSLSEEVPPKPRTRACFCDVSPPLSLRSELDVSRPPSDLSSDEVPDW